MTDNNEQNWKPCLSNRPRTFGERMEEMLPAGIPMTVIATLIAGALFGYPYLEDASHTQAEGLFMVLLLIGIPSFIIACQGALALLVATPTHVPHRRKEENVWAEHGYYREFMPPQDHDIDQLRCVPQEAIEAELRIEKEAKAA